MAQLWQTQTRGLGEARAWQIDQAGGAGAGDALAPAGSGEAMSSALDAFSAPAECGWKPYAGSLGGAALGAVAAAFLIKKKTLSVNMGLALAPVGAAIGFFGMKALCSSSGTPVTTSGYRMFR